MASVLQDLELKRRVEAAIESAYREAGFDITIEDFAGPLGLGSFLQTEKKVAAALAKFAEAAAVVLAISEHSGSDLDPVLFALAGRFKSPVGVEPLVHAEHHLDLIRQVAALNPENPSAKPSAGPGRPSLADTLDRLVLRNVVRAAMHFLSEKGERRSGGWNKVPRTGKAGRRANDQFAPTGAASFVIGVVQSAGIAPVYHQIDGAMTEYVRILKKENREPVAEDYSSPGIHFDDLSLSA